MAITGTVRTYDKRFRFTVQVDGFVSAAFSKVSGLKGKVNVTEHYEGGAILPNKSPARGSFENLTMDRGATANLDMYLWFKSCLNAPADAGVVDEALKRHLDVVQRNRAGTIIKKWSVFGAFPTEFTAGEWDNNSDEVVIESLVLAYDYFDKTL
jgi:phage tail-like protein